LDLPLPTVVPQPHPGFDAGAVTDGDTMIRLQGRLLGLEVHATRQSLDGGPERNHGLPLRSGRVAPLVDTRRVAADFDAMAQLSNLNRHRRHHPAARRSATRTAGRPA